MRRSLICILAALCLIWISGCAKTSFDVELTKVGPNKIAVLKVVKEQTKLNLLESKKIIDKAPVVIQTGMTKEEAEKMKEELEMVGATVTLK